MNEEAIHTLADLAPALQQASNREELEAALAPLLALGEPVVQQLIEDTKGQKTQETAIALTVLGDLAPSAVLRKAARTALQRLHSVGFKPRVAALTVPAPKPAFTPTFFAGYVSLTRERGEVEVILAWYRPQDQVQALVFLLDFWQRGVKDAFITEVMSKRRLQRYVFEERGGGTAAGSLEFVPCTLEQGRALIREGLELNDRLHVPLSKDYNLNYTTVKEYLGDPKAWPLEQTASADFIPPTLSPRQVTEYAMGAFNMHDFGFFYDLCLPTHELRRSVTRLDYLIQSAAWVQSVEPSVLGIAILERRYTSAELESLPSVEMDVFWSLSWKQDQIGSASALLSAPLRTDSVTKRRWFWTAFTLERTDQGWRIAANRDGAAGLRKLLAYDLQARAAAESEQFKELAKEMDSNAELDQDSATAERLGRHGYVALVCFDLLFSNSSPSRRELMVEAADLALQLGDVDRAVSWGEQMMESYPDKGVSAGEIGRIYVSASYQLMDEDPDAAKHFRQHGLQNLELSLKLKPASSVMPYIYLAQLYTEDRRYSEVEALLKTALDMDKNNKEVLSEFGIFYGMQHRNQEALRYLNQLAELDPSYPKLHYSLGLVYRQLEQNDKAREEFTREIERHPADAYAHNSLGLTALFLNDRQDALAALQRAVELLPTNGGFHADVALAAATMSMTKLANDELRLAEQLDPDAPRVKQAKKLLLGE